MKTLFLTIATFCICLPLVTFAQNIEYKINPITGYRQNAEVSPIHVFEGFGYHADALVGQFDLRYSSDVPEKLRRLFFLELNAFTGLKMHKYIPTCLGTEEDRNFRLRARDQALQYQRRIQRDTQALVLTVVPNGSSPAEVEFTIEVFFPVLNKSFIFATDTAILKAQREANLTCDFDGNYHDSSFPGYELQPEMQCQFSAGYSHPKAVPQVFMLRMNGATGTIENLTTSEQRSFEQVRVGYRFNEPMDGHSHFYQYVPPGSSALKPHYLINGGVYFCN